MEIFRMNSFYILILVILGGCTSLNKEEPKVDCRSLLSEDTVQREIQADLKDRFPNYKEAYSSSAGLILHAEGIRYYPVSVKTKEGKVYSVIYNYSPSNEMCKKIGYQFIQLEPKR